MPDKYIEVASGRLSQKSAIASSAGAGDAGKIVATAGDGKLDPTLMPTGFGEDAATFNAAETLSAGDLVYINGTGEAALADASTSGKEAQGYVEAAVTAGQSATVYFEGTIDGLTGLTAGARQYLSTTPGAVTATAPSASGNVVQYVGRATSTTAIAFEPDAGIILE